jgi:hypothetical protein
MIVGIDPATDVESRAASLAGRLWFVATRQEEM